MRKKILNKLGVVTMMVVLPGGLIIGAALVANHYRKKAAQNSASQGDEQDAVEP